MVMNAPNNGILSTIGFILSAYSVYVEHKIHQHETLDDDEGGFKALCDIDAIGASCSAVFSLPEAKLLSYFELVPHDHILDIPNGILGIIYYTYIFVRFILTHDNPSSAILRTLFSLYLNMIISTLAMASSLFLGRKLFILREICVVCITTHAVNTILFYRSIMEIIRGGKVKND